MSFRCDECKHAQPAGTKPFVFIVETRNKIYPIRKRGDVVIDRGGEGWEIVKTKKVCFDCKEAKKA